MFVTAIWLTAPLGWLYGIPFEMLLDPVEAATCNRWLLRVVSVWRVLLFAYVLRVLARAPLGMIVVNTIFLGTIAIMVSAQILREKHLFMIMAGIALPDHAALVVQNVQTLELLAFPVGLITGAMSLLAFRWP